jgi:hypothetical protein
MMRKPTFAESLGIAFGGLGIVLRIYFYLAGRQERIPVFVVDTDRSIIASVDQEARSDFTVHYKGQPLTQETVSLARIFFWNDGAREIRSSDILVPYSITLPKDCSILDVRVLSVTRSISNYRVQPSSSKQNQIDVSFDIAEKGDGVAIQVIYAGPMNSSFSFGGIAVGADQPRVLSERVQPDKLPYFVVIPLIACSLCVPIISIALKVRRRYFRESLDRLPGFSASGVRKFIKTADDVADILLLAIGAFVLLLAFLHPAKIRSLIFSGRTVPASLLK